MAEGNALTGRVSVVLLCGSDLRGVVASLRSLPASPTIELVIVADGSTPRPARAWLGALADRWGGLFQQEESTSEGAARNCGLARASRELSLCLHAGDRLQPALFAAAAGLFAGHPTPALVTSAAGRNEGRADPDLRPLTLQRLIEDFDAAHSASLFRRDDWLALGGFNPSMDGLADTDFWLRLLADGREGAVLAEPLVRSGGDTVRRRLEARQTVALVEQLVAGHRDAFARFALEALAAREGRLLGQAPRYRAAQEEWRRGTAELERLQDAIDGERKRLGAPPEVALGDLRRVTPLSRDWGYERGTPVDRWYIERFLAAHAQDIQGTVLEVQEASYTARFGGAGVVRSEVLDLNASNPNATILADLRAAPHVPDAGFDCIILTQTIHVIDDMRAVAAECERMLKPGGVLLATLPCVSRTCLEYGPDGDFWRVTEAGARALFDAVFGEAEVTPRGNVLASAAFLYGLAERELKPQELRHDDPYNPTLVCVRARKRQAPATAPESTAADVTVTSEPPRGAILLYHRVTQRAHDLHRLAVSPRDFRDHMCNLRDRCPVVPLATLVHELARGQLPAGTVAVTFDDGYEDNLREASPILLELGIPATFFLTTASLDQEPFEYWWDRLERALGNDRPVPPELRLTLPAGPAAFSVRTRAQRLSAHAAIYEAIVRQPADVREGVVRQVLDWSGAAAIDGTNARLGRTGIIELARRPGHALGAHTVNHLALPSQPAAVVVEELVRSRKALEELTGAAVPHLAYPFGACDATTVSAAARAGFTAAVTCAAALVGHGSDPLALPRVDVANGALSLLAALIGPANADAAARSS